MEWNEEVIGRLRSLWDEGMSTAEIGRRLGVSKNAVVGKAHRMALPARPSPIRRDTDAAPRPPSPRRLVGPTLPSLSLAPSLAESSAAECAEPAAPEQALPPAQPSPRIRVVPAGAGRLSACCWPLGEPGTRSFRFCDQPSLPNKPYCAPHAQLAYVRVRDRREDGAAA